MPMYQYACNQCGEAFEKRLRMSQASESQVCPSCGSHKTRKLISMVALGGTTRSSQVTMAPPTASPFS